VYILYEAAEVLSWVDSAEFTGLDQREENRVGFGAALGVSAVPGLAPYHWTSELALLAVVVDGHVAIREEVGKFGEVLQEIIHRDGKLAFGGNGIHEHSRKRLHLLKERRHVPSYPENPVRGAFLRYFLQSIDLGV
jgi:hypothetical protein